MDTPLPNHTFHPLRQLENILVIGIGGHQFAELFGLGIAGIFLVIDFGKRNVFAHHCRWQSLGEVIPHTEGCPADTRGVLQCLLGFNRPVGNHLRNFVAAVLSRHVVDDFAATPIVKVHIDIRHRNPFGVQEAFEEQPVLERIEVGNPHRVSHHGTRPRTSTGSDANPVFLGPLNIVRNHQKVPGETHLQDNSDFVVRAFTHRIADSLRVTVLQPTLYLFDEPGIVILPHRDGELGHKRGAVLNRDELNFTLFGDQQSVVAGLGKFGEKFAHLGRGTQIVVGTVELETTFIGQFSPGVDAQHGVLHIAILGIDIVRVVRGDQRRPNLFRQSNQVFLDSPLDFQAVVHQLHIEILFAKDVLQLPGGAHGFLVLSQPQPGLYLPGGAARRPNQAFVITLQQFAVGARPLAHLPIQGSQRPQPKQIVHPLGGARQQSHMRIRPTCRNIVRALVFIAPPHLRGVESRGPGGDIGLQPDNWLYTSLGSFRIELVSPKQIAVIRNRHRGLLVLYSLRHQLLDFRRPIQNRIVCVDMEVDEIRGSHGSILPR